MDRRFIFTDPEIVSYIQQKFIAFAGEEARFKERYPAWFERLKPMRNAPGVSNRFKQDPNNPNMQGHYYTSFDGRPLGIWRGPYQLSGRQSCLTSMQEAYSLFAGSNIRVKTPDTSLPNPANEPQPNDLVITAYSRPPYDKETGWAGRAQLWMQGNEIAQIIQMSEKPEQSFWMPRTFVMRFIMMGLVDNTFGWQPEWRADDVRKAEVAARCIKTVGNIRTVAIAGQISLRNSGQLVGYDCFVTGELDVDIVKNKVTRFRAYTQGPAWGSRLSDDGTVRKPRSQLCIAFLETTDPTVYNLDMGNAIYAHPNEISSLIP